MSTHSKVELSIDPNCEYGFVEEIKAPKLQAAGKSKPEEEKKQSDSSGLPVYYAAIKLEHAIFI